MSEVKHTPGPWGFWDHTELLSQSDDDGPFFVVGPQRFHTVSEVRAGNTDDGLPAQTAANARLISAAPDLLKELQHLVRLLEPLERDGGLDVPGLATLNGARAAIAKATGA